MAVETPPKEWVCDHCGKDLNRRIRRRENMIGRHVYLFGPPRCSFCARAYHDTLCDSTPYG